MKHRNLLKKLLRNGATQRKEGNSRHLQIQVALLLETRRVKFKPFLWTLLSKPISRSEASVQAEVEAAVDAFKLADHRASYDLDDSAFESEDEY